MRSSTSAVMVASLLVLPTAAPLAAAQLSPAALDSGTKTPPGAMVVLTAFGDGPPTGQHNKRHGRSGDVAKPVEPYHADMHGATRESADKAYRKQFGF